MSKQDAKQIEQIVVSPGDIPWCSVCVRHETPGKWKIQQRIDRESDLIKVDKFSDLEIIPPDPITYRQSIVLECANCGHLAQPQLGVEAWFQGGGENGFGWPEMRLVCAKNEADRVEEEEKATVREHGELQESADTEESFWEL